MLPSKGGTARSLSGGMGSVENSEMYVACSPVDHNSRTGGACS